MKDRNYQEKICKKRGCNRAFKPKAGNQLYCDDHKQMKNLQAAKAGKISGLIKYLHDRLKSGEYSESQCRAIRSSIELLIPEIEG